MEWEDDAYILSARSHGESGAIVDLLTETRGRHAAHVAGGASRRMRSLLQPGVKVIVSYRARVEGQLGSASLEPIGEGPSELFDDPLALSGLAAAAAVAGGALPEREAHPGAFHAFDALIGALGIPDVWPAIFVQFEAGLLRELGFGLDLGKCAATGVTEDLIWVSPRTGRAVSREAGEPYADRLLALPPFMISPRNGLRDGDVRDGFSLTGHFLEQFVFGPLNKPLPPARVWLLERLSDAGRL
ncbi:MAG: DNA repair protein RecO [Caulobacter sp.]|nr:DNA repair protein RecO [Caulobacter sp.]